MIQLNVNPDEHFDAAGSAGVAVVVADVGLQRDATRLRPALGHQPLGQDVLCGCDGATGMQREMMSMQSILEG